MHGFLRFFLLLQFLLYPLISRADDNPKIIYRSEISPEEIAGKQKEYRNALAKLEARRLTFSQHWKSAAPSDRANIRGKAREELFRAILHDIFPAWYGTTWDFNGISEAPGEGKIACGYFVTTCLRDAGIKLQRIKLAQQASQRIIETLAPAGSKKIIYDKPIADVAEFIRSQGTGLYIVGMDTHTGFVVNDGASLAFIHSSYYRPPFSVTAESVKGTNPLADSKYRVFGKILDDVMIEKWITNSHYILKTG